AGVLSSPAGAVLAQSGVVSQFEISGTSKRRWRADDAVPDQPCDRELSAPGRWPPALTDPLWDFADVVASIDAREGPPKKRGPYKPRELAAASRLMNGDALYRHRAGCLDRATQGRKEYM